MKINRKITYTWSTPASPELRYVWTEGEDTLWVEEWYPSRDKDPEWTPEIAKSLTVKPWATVEQVEAVLREGGQ